MLPALGLQCRGLAVWVVGNGSTGAMSRTLGEIAERGSHCFFGAVFDKNELSTNVFSDSWRADDMLSNNGVPYKIMMVSEAFGSGVFAYVSQLCNDMVDYFDVTIVYSAARPETPEDYKDRIDSRVHLIQLDEMSDISLSGIKKSVRELRRIRDELKPDLVHLHTSIAGGLGRIAFDGSDCQVVYTPHGYAHVLMGPGLKSGAFRLIEKLLGRRNCVTLTCCESEDEEARTLCERTAFIETGINLDEFAKQLDGVVPKKRDRFTVFSLGRTTKQKRPDLFNRVAELVPDADFLWVGGGDLEGELTAPNLAVTGWMSRFEALSIAKGADAFILCSYGEAVAMSLLENMYIKKLCLVSDTMGNRSVIRDGVNGYTCTSAEDYAARIKEAMADFPTELPERAYQSVLNTYNTDAMAKKYVDFYLNEIVRDEHVDLPGAHIVAEV